MINQNTINQFFILLFLVSSFGCQRKTSKERVNLSSKLERVKTSDTLNKKNISVEKPAVIYISNNMGKSWSSFANGIPKDAALSGIKQYGNKVYVTTDYHGVFVSSDGEDNWTSLNIEYLKKFDINCIEVEVNKLIIGTLKHGILISNDDGLSWKQSKKILEIRL